MGPYGDRLKIGVVAPADAGRANAELLQFIAAQLGVAKSAVELLSGAASRDKRVALPLSLEPDDIIAALSPRTKKAGLQARFPE